MDLLARFLADAAAVLPADGATIVVAVSGGADSCALWDLLARAGRWTLVVWHLDHGVRGDAHLDAELVRARADAYARGGIGPLRVVVEAEDVPGRAAATRTSLETAGREVRYARLRAIARETGAIAVVVGHHRDDQAETVLANLLRGAGPVGRGGMPPSRPLAPGIALVRPLLGFTRAELRAHLAARALTWREDETNDDTRMRRNFLRRSVLPTFEHAAPGFSAALADSAAESRAHLAQTSAVADAFWREAFFGDHIRIGGIEGVEPEARLLVWRRLVRRLSLPLARRHLRALDHLALGDAGHRYGLGGVEFQRVRGALRWTARATPDDERVVVVNGVGLFVRGAERLMCEALPPPADPRTHGDIAWLDGDQLRWPLAWRPPLRGERWRPLGAPGTQTLGKTMAERGIPSRARGHLAVLADTEGVVWIPGVAIADRARITPQTTDAARFTLTRASDALAGEHLADYGPAGADR